MEYAQNYVAKPGYSEHHTGLAIDMGFLINGMFVCNVTELRKYKDLFSVIHKKLPKFGFILRYPEGKQNITKVGYEPWHIRFINSVDIAKEISNQGICLEEYVKATMK